MAFSPLNSSSSIASRPLGRTGVSVSILGLGTVKFGRDAGVKYPGGVRIPSDEEAAALLTAAEGLGINILDTAPAYGNSEARLGRLLRSRPHPWFVITKAGESWDGAKSTFDFSESAIEASIEQSLSRLAVPQLGCVLLHSDGITEKSENGFSGALRAMQRARAAGVIRTIGASVKSAAGASAALAWADVLMLEFGADNAMRDIASQAAERGVGILAKKALASGHLDTLGREPVRGAMTRTLAIPGVCSVVVGTTNIDHLRENCEAASRAVDELAMQRRNMETGA
ncbi:MAG: aldo/keto reductase [Phycisphaeraceae bacterium]|nr:aldo/keto reductase [Phycisphaeraceae bacterium]